MHRRAVLGRLAADAVGNAALSGCLQPSELVPDEGSSGRANADGNETDGRNETDGGEETGHDLSPDEWRHDVGGGIDTVAEGPVIGQESWEDGDEGIFALDAENDHEAWATETGDGEPVESITVAETREASDDSSIFVHSGEGRLARIDAAGTETWAETVDGRIRDVAAVSLDSDGKHAFVGTDEGVYSLEVS